MIIPLLYETDNQAIYPVPYFKGQKYEPKLLRQRTALRAQFTEAQFAEAVIALEGTVNYGHVSIHLDVRPRMEMFDVLDFIAGQSSVVYEHICNNINPKEATMLENLMNETLVLRKQDGSEVQGIQANVQKNKIFIADGNIPLEEGDVLLRKLPNGLEEAYLVQDRGYYAQVGGIQAHYQSTVTKTKLPAVDLPEKLTRASQTESES